MSDMVGNHEDRFSHNEAHISILYCLMVKQSCGINKKNLIFKPFNIKSIEIQLLRVVI